MLKVIYRNSGTRHMCHHLADADVMPICNRQFKAYANKDSETWKHNISQFVILDVYRYLLLQNPEKKEFVEFYLDDEQIEFDKNMKDIYGITFKLSDYYEEALFALAFGTKVQAPDM